MKLYKNYQNRYYLIKGSLYCAGKNINDLLFNIRKGYILDNSLLDINLLLFIKQYNNINDLKHDYLQELIWNWKFIKLIPFISILL